MFFFLLTEHEVEFCGRLNAMLENEKTNTEKTFEECHSVAFEYIILYSLMCCACAVLA